MSLQPNSVAFFFILAASSGALVHCSSSGGSNDAGAGGGSDAGSDSTVPGTDGSTPGDDGSTPGDDGGIDVNPPDAGPECDAATQCGASATAACCNGHCTDTTLDPRNCGSCGTACTLAQFCNGTKCNDAVFANVCGNAAATVVWDQYDPDNDAGNKVAQALHDHCAPPVVFTQQTNESLVVDDAGRPILGVGNTYLVGGGWYGHPGMNYMDTQKLTKVQVNGDGTNSFIRRLAQGDDLVNIPTASLTATHDYFVIELATEPVSGTLCFAATGMLSPGTEAAGWFLANKVIPSPSTYTDSWYAYQWDDDATPGPGDGDTWTLIASGK